LKQSISPAAAGIVIVIILVLVGYFLWKGTSGGGSIPPGQPGNNGPFAPGGAAVGKGAAPNTASPFSPGGAAAGKGAAPNQAPPPTGQ